MDDCLTADKELKEMLECRPAFSHGGGGKTFMARYITLLMFSHVLSKYSYAPAVEYTS